jgi:hypothetical protein
MAGIRMVAATVIVLTVLTGAVFVAQEDADGRVDKDRNDSEPAAGERQVRESGATSPVFESEVKRTSDGEKYIVDPDKLLMGCPGKDCIPSIDNPKFNAAEESTWLADSDLILGVAINGEAKAYPFRILNVHEIVNDRLVGEPIAATYCPLCRSGFVYSRQVGNRTLEFGVSGRLLNANLVMYDRQTDTFWSQIEGKAIVGPLVPQELRLTTSTVTEWKKWKQSHPNTKVLSRDTGIYPKSSYGDSPYEGFESSSRVGFGVDNVDDRLQSKTIVYGITIGNASKAYSEDVVSKVDVVNDVVNGEPVLVVEDQEEGDIDIFSRQLNNTTLRFRLEGGEIVDQDANRWSFDGVAQEGALRGERLARLPTHGVYWFAWSQFHPGTTVYER